MQVCPCTKVVLHGTLVAAFAVAILASPKAPDDLARRYLRVNTQLVGPLGFEFVVDSPVFMRLAERPQRMLEPETTIRRRPENRWHTRPLYILSAALLAATLRPLMPRSGWRTYPAFIMIHFGALVLAVILFDRLFAAPDRLIVALLPVTSFLVANDVTRAFFWTPHTQMFNVLAPVASMVACKRLLVAERLGKRQLALLGLATGVLPLFYGVFLALLPAMLGAMAARTEPGHARRAFRLLRDGFVLAAAFAAPTVIWALFVRAVSGSFYSAEAVHYRQFLWIVDAWRLGWTALADEAFVCVAVFAAKTWSAVWVPVALLVLVGTLAIALGTPLRESLRAQRATLIAAASTFIALGAFLWLMGSYHARFSWNLAPPVLAVAGCLVVEATRRCGARKARILAVVLLAASLANAGVVARQPPPYLRWAATRRLLDVPIWRRMAMEGTAPTGGAPP